MIAKIPPKVFAAATLAAGFALAAPAAMPMTGANLLAVPGSGGFEFAHHLRPIPGCTWFKSQQKGQCWYAVYRCSAKAGQGRTIYRCHHCAGQQKC